MSKEKLTVSDEQEVKAAKASTVQVFQDPKNVEALRGYNFWVKFHAVLLFIAAGFLILSGLILLIVLVGIVYIAFGVVAIFMGIKLWQSAEQINRLDASEDETQFAANAMLGLSKMRSYFKILGIYTIVALILGVLSMIMLFGYLAFAAKSIQDELRKDPALRDSSSIPMRRDYRN